MNKVTLQISLAPSDYKHAPHVLKHQLSVWMSQVDEVLLTFDTHKSKGRFSVNWEDNYQKLLDFLENLAHKEKKIKLLTIDYSPYMIKAIANCFFGSDTIPAKDWRGGPFYTYFFGLYSSKNDLVFHIDSDMFFGGLSQTWIEEAVNLYKEDERILFINPLPGPPRPDQTLVAQEYELYTKLSQAYKFATMSTRLYLTSKYRLSSHSLGKTFTTNWRALARALWKGNPPHALPEEILSKFMRRNNFYRVDFLGKNPGMWSLHPPYRTQNFYDHLPELITKIEQGKVPNSQLGFYDIVDDLEDWSEAKNKFKRI